MVYKPRRPKTVETDPGGLPVDAIAARPAHSHPPSPTSPPVPPIHHPLSPLPPSPQPWRTSSGCHRCTPHTHTQQHQASSSPSPLFNDAPSFPSPPPFPHLPALADFQWVPSLHAPHTAARHHASSSSSHSHSHFYSSPAPTGASPHASGLVWYGIRVDSKVAF
ncbi:unnamed protein product [Closterium sp. Naga37s-1]|nr:unnamed protein product [Closterium sp. Naga37s-1]